MSKFTRVFVRMSKTCIAALVALAVAGPVHAQKEGTVPSQLGGAPAITTITGAPLTIRVGDEHSFQILNSAIPGVGQIYPSGSAATADMGWFVDAGGTLYAPDFSNHPGGSATGSIGASTPFSAQSISPVSGDGSAANPFLVTVTTGLGGSGLVASEQVLYVNGQNFFQKRFTVTNSGATAQDVRIFLGGDIFLAGSDSGIPYREAATSSPGGQDCATPPTYFILYIPQTPATTFTGTGYSNVWGQIGAAQLDGAIAAPSCIDNGAALQWNRTLAPGASTTIAAATSFGDIPAIAQFNVTSVVPPSGLRGATVPVTISGFGFQPATTFDFGAGIAVSGLAIVNATTATATLTIDPAATLGFRTVTALQAPAGITATLVNGFQVTDGTGGPVAAVQLPVGGLGGLVLLTFVLLCAGLIARRRRSA